MSSHIAWALTTESVDHPRIWVRDTDLTALRAKVASTDATHTDYWTLLRAYCDARLDLATYPNFSYRTLDGEYTAALAFSYLVDPTNCLRHGRRAVDVALYLAGLRIPAGGDKRRYALALALTYDWAYGLLSNTEKLTFRARIADYARVLKDVRDEDLIWGVSQGNVAHALICLLSIVRDGTVAETEEWSEWIDACLDALDDGTDDSYLALHRYFGDSDGGSVRETGPVSQLLEAYARLFPALNTAIAYDWGSNEPWYSGLARWNLWHLRMGSAEDCTLHRQHEVRQDRHFSRVMQAHALQVAAEQGATDFGKACMWLSDLIDATNDEKIEGPYQIWNLLWRDVTVPSTAPTIAGFGGDDELKTFTQSGKLVFRDGWGSSSVSLTVSAPKFFLGGRQQRDAGHLELAAYGERIFISPGHYASEQEEVPQTPGDTDETGHRWTYGARVCSKSTVSIRHTGEDTDQPLEAARRGLTADTEFGVVDTDGVAFSNVGDQRWPKNKGSTKSAPQTLTELLSEPNWRQATLTASDENGALAYAVIGLSSKYWTGKVTRYRRHVLWIKNGQISEWSHGPVILIWDDVVAPADGTLAEKTATLLFQSNVRGIGVDTDTADLQYLVGGALCHLAVASPASVDVDYVSGFLDFDGVEYPPPAEDAENDSLVAGAESVYRTQITPASYAGSAKFVTVLFPGPSWREDHPSVVLIDDGTWVGATIGGVDCKVRVGSTFEAVVGSTGSTPATATASSTSISTSLSTSASTTFTHVTSPPETSTASPARMPQKNPTTDKVTSRLNLAGTSAGNAILKGLAGSFRIELQEGEELQRWWIYSDSGFEKELTWILSEDGDEENPEKAIAVTSVNFGVDTDSGPSGVRNYIEWVTNFGTNRRQFFVKDLPSVGAIYVNNQEAQSVGATLETTSGSDISLGINILPSFCDEFTQQHEYTGNRWANTIRAWGGAFTAEVYLDGELVIAERDIADVAGYYWESPSAGEHTISVRVRAAQGSIYTVDISGTIFVTYATD